MDFGAAGRFGLKLFGGCNQLLGAFQIKVAFGRHAA